MYNHGVMSCNIITGEVGPDVIPSTGSVEGLALGMVGLLLVYTSLTYCLDQSTCAQALDCHHTRTVVLGSTTQRACNCGDAVEGARTGATDAGAVRACGDHTEACCVMGFG